MDVCQKLPIRVSAVFLETLCAPALCQLVVLRHICNGGGWGVSFIQLFVNLLV